MKHLRSALKDQFGRRMFPQVGTAEENEVNISIECRHLRLQNAHLETVRSQHPDVCQIRDDKVMLEGNRDSVLSCTQAMATLEEQQPAKKNGSRSDRRKVRPAPVRT
jgi:hypothetical protein